VREEMAQVRAMMQSPGASMMVRRYNFMVTARVHIVTALDFDAI
jgi:hypothetical protein